MKAHSTIAPTDLKKAIALVIATGLVTTAAVAFVRLKSLQVEAGYRVHDLRMRLVALDQQRAALEVERAALARPQRIAHLARTELGLVHVDAALATDPRARTVTSDDAPRTTPGATTTTTATTTTATTTTATTTTATTTTMDHGRQP
jgi:cell division protein FtsL